MTSKGGGGGGGGAQNIQEGAIAPSPLNETLPQIIISTYFNYKFKYKYGYL